VSVLADDVYKIEIPIDVVDNTNPGLSKAQNKVTAFERSMKKTESQLNKMNRTKWSLILSAIDRASSVISSVGLRARTLVSKPFNFVLRTLDYATRPIRGIFNLLSSGLGMLGMGAGLAGIGAGIVIPIKMAADFEQTQIAFTTMLKSADKATKFLKEIENMAAVTPFEFPDLLQSSKLLLAFGFQAKQIIPMMTKIGDAASGLGVGAEGIDRITRALGQMKAKGRVQAEELLQLQELGVPATEILQQELGLTAKQIANIGEKSIASGKVIDAILRGLDKRFGGMMKNQSETMNGLLSTIKDVYNQNIVKRWGEGFRSVVTPQLKAIVDWADKNTDSIKKWGDALENTGKQIAEWVVNKVEKLKNKLNDLVGSPEWANATTLGEKIKVTFDKLDVNGIAAKFGSGLGGAIGSFIMSALGVATDPNKAMKDSPFLSAGASAGKAFLDAFLEAFDAKKIADKALEALGSIAKDAAKVMPGGAQPSSTTWISDIIIALLGTKALGWLGKGGKAAVKGGKGISSVWSFIKNIFGKGGAKTAAGAAAETAAAAGAANTVKNTIPIYGANGEILSEVIPSSAKMASQATNKASWLKSLTGKVGSFFKDPAYALGTRIGGTVGVAMDLATMQGSEDYSLKAKKAQQALDAAGYTNNLFSDMGIPYNPQTTKDRQTYFQLKDNSDLLNNKAWLAAGGSQQLEIAKKYQKYLSAINGGIPIQAPWDESKTPAITSKGSQLKIDINLMGQPAYNISTNANETDVIDAIKKNQKDIGNVIGKQIAEFISGSWGNQPTTDIP